MFNTSNSNKFDKTFSSNKDNYHSQSFHNKLDTKLFPTRKLYIKNFIENTPGNGLEIVGKFLLFHLKFKNYNFFILIFFLTH